MAKSYTTISAPAVTALNSLADAAYWVGGGTTGIDNSTQLAYEIEMFVTILTTTTAGSDGSVDVYIAGSVDGGTDFAGGITTESDATYTPAGDDVSEWTFVGSFTYTSETTARTLNKRFLIDDVPKNFKVVIFNDTGTALGATTCAVELNAIKY